MLAESETVVLSLVCSFKAVNCLYNDIPRSFESLLWMQEGGLRVCMLNKPLWEFWCTWSAHHNLGNADQRCQSGVWRCPDMDALCREHLDRWPSTWFCLLCGPAIDWWVSLWAPSRGTSLNHCWGIQWRDFGNQYKDSLRRTESEICNELTTCLLFNSECKNMFTVGV